MKGQIFSPSPLLKISRAKFCARGCPKGQKTNPGTKISVNTFQGPWTNQLPDLSFPAYPTNRRRGRTIETAKGSRGGELHGVIHRAATTRGGHRSGVTHAGTNAAHSGSAGSAIATTTEAAVLASPVEALAVAWRARKWMRFVIWKIMEPLFRHLRSPQIMANF